MSSLTHEKTKAERVLVVEDDETVRLVLQDTLLTNGYDTSAVQNGVEALAFLERTPVDLILSDISMPEMDGYALYERVRSRPEWITTPFVFLTALGQQERVRYAKRLGVDDYLVKPVGAEDLLLTVRALLERRRRIESARSAQIAEIKSTLVTTLGHELRTPLTSLSGYAELLRDAAAAGRTDQIVELTEGILRGADRLCRLAKDLVTLVELRSGDASRRFQQEHRAIRDLPALLRDTLMSRTAAAEARGVSLAADLPETLPVVIGEAVLLCDAIGRLVDNGIKFSRRDDGRVVLRARADQSRVVIEVQDSGVGIPGSELPRVTELFYQVDRRRHEQQGTGSGLTIVHAVLLMHGGTLDVRSDASGSTFSASLPMGAVSA